MKMHALILSPGDDILLEIQKYCQLNNISIGVILSTVGDVSEAKLLNSRNMEYSTIKEPMDIVGISGTVSASRTHLHIIFSRSSFNTIGGHLSRGCYIRNSAEIIIGEFAINEASNEEINDDLSEDISGYVSEDTDENISDSIPAE